MGGADMISILPDSVIHHILSSLATKEVVRTCTLSKRWECLWTGVPSLIFDSDEFRDKRKFVKFVNSVFESRQLLNLDIFKLRCSGNTSTFKAAVSWLSRVVEAKPRVIVLDISGKNHLDFADYVFTCESLEELNLSTSLSGDSYAPKPNSILLKRLKKLSIHGSIDLDDDFMNKLMRSSPVLEELQLSCNYDELSIFSSQSLKHLEIYCCPNDSFEISAPSLLSLYIEGAVPGRISCNNLVSLVEAHIEVDYCQYDGEATLLSGFSNAEKLHFDKIESLDMFVKELPNCPTFHKLKELNCQVTSFYPIAWFLQHAPDLEKLTMRYYFGCNSFHEKEFYKGRDMSFSCKKLKTIEICYADIKEKNDAVKLLSYNKKLPGDVKLKFRRL